MLKNEKLNNLDRNPLNPVGIMQGKDDELQTAIRVRSAAHLQNARIPLLKQP
jgi:hypothetical protein